MTKLVPDKNNIREVIISNDAFFYMFAGEEMLDDENYEEVEEIEGYFPSGYIILDGWKCIANGLVEASFAPLIQQQIEEPNIEINGDEYDEYDGVMVLNSNYIIRIKLTQAGTHVKVWRGSTYLGEFKLRYNNAKKKFVGFATGNYKNGEGCLFWLKDFREVRPGALRPAPNLPVGA